MRLRYVLLGAVIVGASAFVVGHLLGAKAPSAAPSSSIVLPVFKRPVPAVPSFSVYQGASECVMVGSDRVSCNNGYVGAYR